MNTDSTNSLRAKALHDEIFARHAISLPDDTLEAAVQAVRGERYPQWKIDAFNNRNAGRCTCPEHIPGVEAERWSETCSVHGEAVKARREAAEGRSIVENDAIQKEHQL